MFCASVITDGAFSTGEVAYLRPEHFTDKNLGEFWKSVLGGSDWVAAAESAGVMDRLLALVPNVSYLVRAPDYARLIARDSYMMDVAGHLSKIANSVATRDFDAIRSAVDAMKNESVPGAANSALYPADIAAQFASVVNSPKAIMTGIGQIDSQIGGLFPKELTVVASRPGLGKTALLLTLAQRIAKSGKKVLFVTLEMSAVQLWARMACGSADLEWKDVRRGNITAPAKNLLLAESTALEQRLGDKLIIVEDKYNVFDIHHAAAQLSPDIVMIDQLPEIEWHEPGVSEVQWYGRALRYLRQHIAVRMDVPLMVVHQINRGVEARQDKHPLLSDLRQSGEIEQRSDAVWLLFRPDYYEPAKRHGAVVPLEITVAKNRQGADAIAILTDYNLREQWIY